MRAADVLGPDGPLAKAIAGYEHRPGQMRMAEAVEEALRTDGILLVEAGTGVGKTLAYLIPAVLSGKKVVVSTGTRALQDQIMEHDLPLIDRHVAPVDAACMKGLGNYLCLRRYEELRSSADSVGPLARHLPMIETFRATTESGDRAELAGLAEDAPIWASVMSGSDTRIGPRCPHHDACFVTKMRRRAEEARIVVVNHHLFFADLALRGPRGAAVLPDHDVVVFDEAHQLEEVATRFFGVSLSTGKVERLVRDAERALGAARLDLEASPHLGAALAASDSFFGSLPRAGGPESARAPLPREQVTGEVERRLFALDDALDALGSFCKRRAHLSEGVAQIARRATEMREDLAAVADGGRGKQVAWVQARGRSVSVGASPIDVSDLLRAQLFHRGGAVVLTSATLATGGSFAFVRRRLGIDGGCREEVVASPFDYQRQAGLYLPGHLGDPRSESFADEAAREVTALLRITGGGAFVLSTSLRMMHELAARARPTLGLPMLVQGEAPKRTLLARFRAAGDAVLFATASFWEGIDVPGDALRLVVLDKLPFDVPSDPLVAARCERLREDGEHPFMGYLVPAAALSLKQGFGRLIRSRRDHGIVAILDSRILKKGYGRVFLDSLPSASRCYSLDEVSAFYAAARGGSA